MTSQGGRRGVRDCPVCGVTSCQALQTSEGNRPAEEQCAGKDRVLGEGIGCSGLWRSVAPSSDGDETPWQWQRQATGHLWVD